MSPRDFIYPNSPYIDHEFEDFIKLLKGRGDFDNQYIRHQYRHLNKSYFHHVRRSVTQPVVIKIISKGATKSHLNVLLNYVSRNLESQKEEEKTPLYNQDNEEIPKDEFGKVIDDWSDKFDNFTVTKEDKEIIDQINTIKNDLETKHFETGLSKKEGQFLRAINLFEERKLDKDGFSAGSLCRHKGTGDLGFILDDEHKENKSFYSIYNYPHISKSIIPLESLEVLDCKIQKIMREKPNNFSHIVLSAGGDKPDTKAVLEATKDFLEFNFKSKGYDYAYTMHYDTQNPHIHVIVNNHSKQHDYKLCPNKYDLQELRMDYTRHLDGYGVNRSAVLKQDRSDFLERVKKEVQNNQNYDLDWYKHKLNDKKDNNFDLLKFKKGALYALDSISKKLENMDEKELAQQVKDQKQEFIEAERNDISKVLENTMSILEKDGQKWEKYCAQPFYNSIGDPSQFDKDTEKIREKMLEKYEANLEKTKEDLEELFYLPLSDKMEARKERALNHIHKKLVELDKGLGREPRERDDGFCREMER